MIDIRRQDPDSHLTAGHNVFCHFHGIVNNRSHQGCHKFYRIIIFQPGCLIGHDGVGCRMGFIEGILGKIRHFIKDSVGCCFINAIGDTARYTKFLIAVDKILALLGHNIGFFLGHSSAHKVTSAKIIAGQLHNDLHNLFLIHNTAIGWLENLFQLRAFIADGCDIIFALDVAGNEIHRARTIKGNAGNDVFQIMRF